MSVSADGMLLSAAVDMRHRHLRLIHGIRQLSRHPDPAMRALLGAAERKALQRLRDFERSLRDLIQLVGATATPSLDVDVSRAWTDFARQQYHALQIRQREILRYIPLPTSVPADIGFFLARGLELSPTRSSHRQRFALSLSSFSSWESEPFGEAATRVAALPVPFAETMTPLRWPYLLHELGHHILPASPADRRLGLDDTEKIITDLLGTAPVASDRANYREVLADRVAERHCGPAYAFALARETVLAGGPTNNEAPSIYQRLSVLSAWSQLSQVLPVSWEPALRAGNDSANLQAPRELALERMPDRADLSPRMEMVAAAELLMLKQEPAGSVRLIGPVVLTPDVVASADAAAIDSLFVAGADVVARDSEVICAAWAVESCKAAQHYLDELASGLLEGDGLDQVKADESMALRSRLDTGISRALQSIGVHSWLLTHDDAIHAAVSDLYRDSDENASAMVFLDSQIESDLTAGDSDTDRVESSPLSDVHLLRRLTESGPRQLVVRPLVDPMQIGGTTIDLRLGTEWEVLRTSRFQALDPADAQDSLSAQLDSSFEQFRLTSGQNQGLVLHPGELILALTLEYLKIPPDLWGNVEGRSTWARLGLQVHASAGMIDAGFNGYLTLELQNMGRLPMVLSPGLRVAQVALFPVAAVARPYRSKPGAAYSDQTTARTAFPIQHEHRALRDYLQHERDEEVLDVRAVQDRLSESPALE